MAVPGVGAGDGGEPHHRVLVHADQATGLADAATLLQVLQDGEGLVLGKLAAVQRRPLALGETGLAGTAGQDATLFMGAIAEGNAEVAAAALAVVGALRVEAAEDFQVVHGCSHGHRQAKKYGTAAGIGVESICTLGKPDKTRPNGDGAAFFEHVADDVDWIVMGTQPLANASG